MRRTSRTDMTAHSVITEWMEWMSHRKQREMKQQPSMLPGPAVPGCCWISLHFLFGKLSTRTVLQLKVHAQHYTYQNGQGVFLVLYMHMVRCSTVTATGVLTSARFMTGRIQGNQMHDGYRSQIYEFQPIWLTYKSWYQKCPRVLE